MVRFTLICILVLGFLFNSGTATAAEPPKGPASVAVTLELFEALPDANGVRVVWVTSSEQNTLGFRILRATARNGPLTRLTGLIATQAPNGGGARYEFVDRTAEAGNTYYYYLDAVGTNGQTLRYGPAEIDLTPTAVTVSRLEIAPHDSSRVWVNSILATAGVTLLAFLHLRRR